MIAGRLEIIPVLALFSIHTWKEGEFTGGPLFRFLHRKDSGDYS